MTIVAHEQSHLAVQDASTVDPSKLTALSPEVVSSKPPVKLLNSINLVCTNHSFFLLLQIHSLLDFTTSYD